MSASSFVLSGRIFSLHETLVFFRVSVASLMGPHRLALHGRVAACVRAHKAVLALTGNVIAGTTGRLRNDIIGSPPLLSDQLEEDSTLAGVCLIYLKSKEQIPTTIGFCPDAE